MAKDSLLVATSIAAGIDPNDHESIAQVSEITGAVIDATQQAHDNGAGVAPFSGDPMPPPKK
jgi:hypothetical protein